MALRDCWVAPSRFILELSKINAAHPEVVDSIGAIFRAPQPESIPRTIEGKIDISRCFIRDSEFEKLSHGIGYNNFALIGDLGAGKTTLMRRLMNAMKPHGHICRYLDLSHTTDLQYESNF